MKTVLLTFIALIAFFVPNDITHAYGSNDSQVKRNTQSKSTLKIYSSRQAAKLVKRRFNGKVLNVKKQTVNGNSGYKVKLIKKNGHVVSVLVDAKSGRVIGGN
ncbi:MAG: putative membrane protein YkoI [Alteromonadaceae bacterium]|jgi:uncharacterized membrane protein YkoI|tara:strand:- start:677 stop:985 length:309 start_codon:yes stop_codon:yes gene_type:complete